MMMFIGVYYQDDEYKVVLQGNEEEGEEIAHVLMSAVSNQEQIASYTVIEKQPEIAVDRVWHDQPDHDGNSVRRCRRGYQYGHRQRMRRDQSAGRFNRSN